MHACRGRSFALVLCCALVLVTELPSDCSELETVSHDLFRCLPECSRDAACMWSFRILFFRVSTILLVSPCSV